jgi:hypothetical protein
VVTRPTDHGWPGRWYLPVSSTISVLRVVESGRTCYQFGIFFTFRVGLSAPVLTCFTLGLVKKCFFSQVLGSFGHVTGCGSLTLGTGCGSLTLGAGCGSHTLGAGCGSHTLGASLGLGTGCASSTRVAVYMGNVKFEYKCLIYKSETSGFSLIY